MKSPVSLPEPVPGLVTHADPLKPRTGDPGGRNEQLREDRCATLLRNRPTWAVMGRSTTAGEIAHAQLNGLLEEDQ